MQRIYEHPIVQLGVHKVMIPTGATFIGLRDFSSGANLRFMGDPNGRTTFALAYVMENTIAPDKGAGGPAMPDNFRYVGTFPYGQSGQRDVFLAMTGGLKIDTERLQEAVKKGATVALVTPDVARTEFMPKMLERILAADFECVAAIYRELNRDEVHWLGRNIPEGEEFSQHMSRFTAGPVVQLLLTKKEEPDVPAAFQKLMGSAVYTQAEEGTLRHEFAVHETDLAIYGSADKASALAEAFYFFDPRGQTP